MTCVIRVIRFWSIFRTGVGFFRAAPVKTGAAFFDFPALFEYWLQIVTIDRANTGFAPTRMERSILLVTG
jgi:hypothetical protein